MEAEKRLWKKLSQVIVYRDTQSLDDLADLRKPESQSGEKAIDKEEEAETADD